MALEHLGRAPIARTRSATFFSPLSLSATMRSSTLPTVKDGLAWTSREVGGRPGCRRARTPRVANVGSFSPAGR